MSWSYDSADLSTSTLSGQLNSTRFLLGDTNTNDQQVENEEVLFALAQNGYNIYKSAAWLARSLAAKYAKKVDIDLDGALSGAYSQLQEHFYALAGHLETMANKSGSGWSVKAGGISKTQMSVVNQLTDRVDPAFKYDKFDNPPGDYNE